eukprot:SAG31_NODE_225_length_19846_cov_19.057983_22_plen_41_part_00
MSIYLGSQRQTPVAQHEFNGHPGELERHDDFGERIAQPVR